MRLNNGGIPLRVGDGLEVALLISNPLGHLKVQRFPQLPKKTLTTGDRVGAMLRAVNHEGAVLAHSGHVGGPTVKAIKDVGGIDDGGPRLRL